MDLWWLLRDSRRGDGNGVGGYSFVISHVCLVLRLLFLSPSLSTPLLLVLLLLLLVPAGDDQIFSTAPRLIGLVSTKLVWSSGQSSKLIRKCRGGNGWWEGVNDTGRSFLVSPIPRLRERNSKERGNSAADSIRKGGTLKTEKSFINL